MAQTRREFLATAAILAANGKNSAAALRTNPMNKPIGLQLYTVDEQLAHDFNGTLKQIASIGYKEVELAATYNKSAGEMRTAFGELGLHCRSVHHFNLEQTPTEVMEFAKELGATYIVTSFNPPASALAAVSSPKPDFQALVKLLEGMTLDDYKRSAETCNKLGEEAKKRGLVYAYHNHNLEFKQFGDMTAYDLLLQSTDPEIVKMELDCGWAAAAGKNPVSYLEEHPDRYRLLHIKGFKAGPPSLTLVGPSKPVPTELGRGSIDYRPIFAAAKKTAVEQYYVEQEPPFKDMSAMAAIKADYEYLHNLTIG